MPKQVPWRTSWIAEVTNIGVFPFETGKGHLSKCIMHDGKVRYIASNWADVDCTSAWEYTPAEVATLQLSGVVSEPK